MYIEPLDVTGKIIEEKYPEYMLEFNKLKKIIIPFVCWTIIIVLFKFISNQWQFDSFNIKSFINTILSNQHYTPYYYIYWILGIYITMPILTPLAKKENKSILAYSIIIMFIFNCFIPVVLSMAKVYNPQLLFGFSTIYILAGYYFNKYTVKEFWKKIIYISAILCTIYKLIYVYVNMSNGILVRDFLLSYTNFYIVIWSFAVFILQKIFLQKKTLNVVKKYQK